MEDQQSVLVRCSFCDKSQREVRKMIAGPKAYICDECVDICVDVVSEEDDNEFITRSSVPMVGYAPRSSEEIQTVCSLCAASTSVTVAITVPGRGALCSSCAEAVEVAIAESRGNSA